MTFKMEHDGHTLEIDHDRDWGMEIVGIKCPYKERIELLKLKLSMSKASKQVGWFQEWVDDVLYFLDDPNPDTRPLSGFVHKSEDDEVSSL